MVKLRSWVLAAGGLTGGFALARKTGNRPVGGAVWLLAGALCLPTWLKAGPYRTVFLSASYAGALGGSHPLARKVGAWPAVGIVSAAMASLALGGCRPSPPVAALTWCPDPLVMTAYKKEGFLSIMGWRSRRFNVLGAVIGPVENPLPSPLEAEDQRAVDHRFLSQGGHPKLGSVRN